MSTLTIRSDNRAVSYPCPVEQFSLQTLLGIAKHCDVTFRQVHDREFSIVFEDGRDPVSGVLPDIIDRVVAEMPSYLDPTLITPNVKAYLELLDALRRARREGVPGTEEKLERFLADLRDEVFTREDQVVKDCRTIVYTPDDQHPVTVEF